MNKNHEQYLLEIEEASLMAHKIAQANPHLDFMDIFRSFLNFNLSPEERLRRGLRRYE